jgi:hypothetical protein
LDIINNVLEGRDVLHRDVHGSVYHQILVQWQLCLSELYGPVSPFESTRQYHLSSTVSTTYTRHWFASCTSFR